MTTDTDGLRDRARSSRLGRRLLAERYSSYWLTAAGYTAIALFAGITLLLFYRSLPILSEYPLSSLLTSTDWDPAANDFGFLPAIVGTVYVTVLSMAMGIPVALGAAIYIAEYAEGRMKTLVAALIDVLAAVPSVIFGLVALIVVVPFIGNYVAPVFGENTGAT